MPIDIKVNANDLTKGQLSFLQSQSREVLLSGGYGAGKTLALALKAIALIAANPGVPGLIIAPNWRTLWGVTYRRLLTVLRSVLKREELPRVVDKQVECYLDFGDGNPIYLRSANNVDGYDGLDVGWAVGDEARYWDRHAYNVLQGRVRVKCPQNQIALASTPSMGWMSEEFNTGREGRALIVSPTKDNAHNLAPGFIENIKASYSKRLWRALVEGLFTILEGAVFEDFDPSETSPWIVDFEPKQSYLADHRCYLAVDPGFRRSAWLWIVEDAPQSWIVYDQAMLDGVTDMAAVHEVNRRGWPIDEIWCDPASGNVQSFEGASTIRALKEIHTRGGRSIRHIGGVNREIAFGVDKLRVLLGGDDTPRRIRFAKRLLKQEQRRDRGIIKDVGSLRYPEAKDGRPVSDVPVKDGVTDHSTDALRYWAVGRWLCDPKLRRSDPVLAARGAAGWKAAA